MPRRIPAGWNSRAAEGGRDLPFGPSASIPPPPFAVLRRQTVLVPTPSAPPPRLLSVVIPARDEEGSIAVTVEHVHAALAAEKIEHELLVVDDGSTDRTRPILDELAARIPELRPLSNPGPHGFGRAVIYGLDRFRGDAVAVMMADESDDAGDLVRYWRLIEEGWDCAFGSRFVRGGKVFDYPRLKLWVNRIANRFVAILFNIRLNDTTNAFKCYRREVIEGCRPLLAPHFNLTVELPLKAIVRGYTWKVTPITWRNRKTGVAKLKMREMGSRYLFIVLYVWLEKYFSRGDYRRPVAQATGTMKTPAAEPTAAEERSKLQASGLKEVPKGESEKALPT